VLDWFRRRGERPKRLAELSPDELDAILDGHPELAHLLRHAIGILQFAPPRVAERLLARVEGIVDETLRRRLSPEAEHDFVMRELQTLQEEWGESGASGRSGPVGE
jgi:hypothetical protein